MFNRSSDGGVPRRTGLASSRRRNSPRRRAASRRFSIEGLEARALLSTMYVDDDWAGSTAGAVVGEAKVFGTNAFATIQSAITAATAGDAIQVAEGNYSGAVSIGKSVSIVGAGAEGTTLDVSAIGSAYGVTISAANVSLSGLTILGSTSNAKLRYGVYSSGATGIALSDLVVTSMPTSGVNLIGATDFTIDGVASRDNGGAGFFFTDVKRATLTDVATSGNAWTGVGFSTAGRYYAIGVEGVVIAGASTFGESATDNAGIMFEESSWDATAKVYDPTNPHPITFSTNPLDGADVTFAMEAKPGYVLSGPQDDAWSVRRRFYATAEQGLAAASGSPSHYLEQDRTLATVGAYGEARTFLVAPSAMMSIQAAIDAAAAGDTIQVAAGTYEENLSIGKSVSIVGAGAADTTLDVSGSSTANGVTISAANVSLSGLTILGSTSNAKLRYGVVSYGTTGLTLSNLIVTSMPSSGVNLNGATDFTIDGVTSRDNGGAGFFLTDVKRATLTDVTTIGNGWTGVGFSTAGRYYPIGVEDVLIAGNSNFVESATDNGGIMFEESSWDATAKVYDPTNPHPITFSTDVSDGADVTFAMVENPAYVLSGPQDDAWSVRRRFYATAEQGLAAASGSPSHYLEQGRTLATVGAYGEARTFLVAPSAMMSIQAAIDAAAAGDTVQVAAGTYEENLSISRPIVLEAIGEVTLQPGTGTGVSITGAGSQATPILVRGFRIEGGDVGVGIHGAASGVILEDVSISGAGVGVEVAAAAEVSGASFEGLDASGNGVGFLAEAGASVTGLVISGSHFDGNTTDGFRILAGPTGGFDDLTVSDTTFDGNGGSGLYAEVLDQAAFSAVAFRDNIGAGVDVAVQDGAHGGLTFSGSTFTGNGGPAIRAGAEAGAALDDVAIVSNVIASNGAGVEIGLGATGVEVHWNRIVGNVGAALANLSAAAVDAVHNWWGSNDGPGAGAVGLVDASPYIVLTLAGPGAVLVGGSAGLTADLNHDSTGADVSGLGSIPGVSAIGFSTTLGSVSPTSAAVVDGAAASGFSAGATPGWGVLSATVDGAVAQVAVQVTIPTLTIAGPATVDQGSPYTLSLTAGPEAGVVSRWWIDWGDGTTQEVAGSPSTVAHLYPATPGSYAVRAWADTSLGVFEAGAALTVAVLNVAPTAAIADGPTAVDQGTLASFTAVASDPGGVAGYAWTASLNGVEVASGSGASFEFVPTRPGAYAIVLTVIDAHGGSTVVGRELTVANVAPSLELAAIPGQFEVGATVPLSAVGSDPNPAAVLAYVWTVRRDGVEVATGQGPSLAFTPTVAGLYEAVVQVSDGEGGVTSRSTSFEVVAWPIVGPLPPPAERAVETTVARAEAQLERQDQRIAELTARFEAAPSPIIQRMIRQAVQAKARIQVMTARRIVAIQRTFSIMGRGRRG